MKLAVCWRLEPMKLVVIRPMSHYFECTRGQQQKKLSRTRLLVKTGGIGVGGRPPEASQARARFALRLLAPRGPGRICVQPQMSSGGASAYSLVFKVQLCVVVVAPPQPPGAWSW